jgi:hypothetical protein
VRKYAAVPLGLLVAALCFGAVADAAGIITPIKVSASVSPKFIGAAPYTWVTSGTIRFNPVYCPPGTTNPAYCTTITAKQACSGGKLSLKVHIGRDPLLADANTTVKSTSGKASSKCTYSIKTKIPKADFTSTSHYVLGQRGQRVYVRFRVKFLGTSVLNAKSARTQYVKAVLTEP